ncbi:MAG TPA: Ig-like domain-containing protein, partial [Lacipirellulaceae bacterium]|nr:Ig-like domain-containing protein [Lacipirellulaceae bacterium]
MLRTWIRRIFEQPAPARRAHARPVRRERRWLPSFEVLEDRTVPSTSIPLSSIFWTAMGPAPIAAGQTPGNQPVSGRVTAIAADPFDPNVIFVGTAGGGVWRTTNAGATWQALTDIVPTPTPSLSIGSVAVARSNTNIIYAGTGEASNTDVAGYGRGILKSTDRGLTWQMLGTSVFDRKAISSIQVDPTNPNNVYVAVAESGLNSLTGGNGIWRSTDGGLNWTNTTASAIAGSAAQSFSDLAMDPTNPQILYAAIGTSSGSALNGVYRTTNGGNTWTLVGPTLPSGASVGRVKIALAANDTQRLFVSFSSTAGATFGSLAGFYRTDNAGGTWLNLTPTTPNYMQGGGHIASTLAVSPVNRDVVYAGGFGGTNAIIQSTDGGLGWNQIFQGLDGIGPHADHHGIGFDAIGRLLDGNGGGINRLENPIPGSTQWIQLNGSAANPGGWLNSIQFNGIGIHPTNADLALGGSQDNGLSQFQDSLGWTLRQNFHGGDVAYSLQNPNRVYATGPVASFGAAAFFRRSDNGGTTWSNAVTGINAGDPQNTFQPFVVDPNDGNRLVFGTNRVYLTTNGGTNWSPISTVGVAGWVTSSPIDALAIAASAPQTIYASAGGRIYVTTNNGTAWTERNPLPIAANARFTDIVVDPTNSQTLYVTTGNFRGGLISGSIFRSTDGGANWSDLTANLPNTPTWSFAFDPRTASPTDDVYFVGTDMGVYASFDQGTSWFRYGVGLPTVPVRDLEFNANRSILAAGTYGRGMWQIINDAQPVNLSIVAGTPQTTEVTTDFGTNLQVLVTNPTTGTPISGFAVIFTTPLAGASAAWGGSQQLLVFTNASGIATAPTLTANTIAGSYFATASSVAGNAVQFDLTNTPGAAANILVHAGSPQSTSVGSDFATLLAARVTDVFGNGISGATVTFTAPPGPGATGTFAGGVASVNAVTDANGVATATVLTANTVVGNFTVTATTAGVGGVANFDLTNVAGAPASIVVVAGTPQSTIVNTLFGTALQAQVFDAFGNAVAGVDVTFALPGSGPSGIFAGGGTVTTDANGIATANPLTANTIAGSFQVSASVAGVATPAIYNLTNLPGPAASITVTAGSPQAQIITLDYPTLMQVLVTDQFGNVLAGQSVTFTAPGSEPTGT